MWIDNYFKVSEQTQTKAHSKFQDSILAFHSSLVFLVSGIAGGGQSKGWE